MAEALKGPMDDFIKRVVEKRDNLDSGSAASSPNAEKLQLISREGVNVGPVKPTPWFSGKPVTMYQGFLKTSEINLWKDNDRLLIHLEQFRQIYNRPPTPQELYEIMVGITTLPGISNLPELSEDRKMDQFAIRELAHSIAVNGVQRPPILDTHFNLLDGNRRVAACQYILNSNEFNIEEKKRAEYIFVWQLSEHTDGDDRYNIIIALNFESDYKEKWPEYVKIRRVYEAWQEMLTLNPIAGEKEQLTLRKKIASKFAMDLVEVTRYIKMMTWVDEFEEFHINEKGKDKYQVKHRANRYVQYFDELSKGTTPGSVAFELRRDDGLRKIVFDLLYDGKFKNYTQIRDLKYIYDDKGGRDALIQARDEPDIDVARGHLEDAWVIARSESAQKKELGANKRIEVFVDWLEKLPPKSFRDVITPEALQHLLDALKLVEPLVRAVKKLTEREQ